MRIALVVDPYAEKKPSGLGRAVFEMARGILTEDKTNTYTVYFKNKPATPPVFLGSHNVESFGGRSLFFGGARALKKDLDLYVFFTPIMPLFFFPKKSVVVVHDFAYLEMPGRTLKERLTAIFLYIAHRITLAKATRIVAVSQWTKESVVRHFHVSPEKVEVIYNGLTTFPEPAPIEVPTQFFLFAGVLKPRKNVLGVIRALAQLAKPYTEVNLCIVGKQEGDYYARIVTEVEALGLKNKVQFLGYVSDAELAYLYTKTLALVFPSFIEGFGLQVLEAMSLGAPVIISDSGALKEMAGGAGLLVDPHEPEDIARAMLALLENPSQRRMLSEKGLVRAKEFSWEKTAKQFLENIERLGHTGSQ